MEPQSLVRFGIMLKKTSVVSTQFLFLNAPKRGFRLRDAAKFLEGAFWNDDERSLCLDYERPCWVL